MQEFELNRDALRITPEEWDRFVDGELDECAYRDLLLRCEEAWIRGDGGLWRSCALALLEAQALQRDLGSWSAEQPLTRPVTDFPKSTRRSHAFSIERLLLACAVVLLLAFTIAAVFRPSGPFPIAQFFSPKSDQTTEPDLPPQTLTTQGPSVSAPLSSNDAARQPNDLSHSSPYAEFDTSAPSRLTGRIVLTVETTGGASPHWIEVPIYEVTTQEAAFQMLRPSSEPFALIEALEASGHHVTMRPQLWPLKLDDGRRVIVPIEQLIVAPAQFQ